MEFAFLTYIILQLDILHCTLTTFMGLILLALCISALLFGFNDPECSYGKREHMEKLRSNILEFCRKLVKGFVLILVIKTLTPSTDGAKYIAAAYGLQTAAQSISQNEDAKRIAGKSLAAIEQMLDKVSVKEEPVKK